MKFDTLLKNAHVPYSGNPRACVVMDQDNQHFIGVSVENLSYPLSISHIQSALYSCLAKGQKPKTIVLPFTPTHADLVSYWEGEYGIDTIINPDFEINPVSVIENYTESEIVKRLTALCDDAVIPNSDFPVSCLLETKDGFVSGVNIECSNWELGLCAERVTIATAISHGYSGFLSIHIMAPKSDYVSPCGGCRQVLMEHLPKKRVYLYQNEFEKMTLTTSQLLPYHFEGDSLKK
jgi:homotetrameric cytidine deaminase